MAQTLKLKRYAVAGKVPSTTQLEIGELALNTNDGRAFFKSNDGADHLIELGEISDTSTIEIKEFTSSASQDTFTMLQAPLAREYIQVFLDGSAIRNTEFNVYDKDVILETALGSGVEVRIHSFLPSSLHGGAEIEIKEYDATASQTTFSLDHTPLGKESLAVSVEGLQKYDTDYSISGNDIVFNAGLSLDDEVRIVNIYEEMDNSATVKIESKEFTATASQTNFTLLNTPLNKDNVFVAQEGLILYEADYSISGNDVVLNTGATVGDKIRVSSNLRVAIPISISGLAARTARFRVRIEGFDAIAGVPYMVNLSAAATAILPAWPTDGDSIRFLDGLKNFATYNLTIGRNGKSINGVASDYALDTDGSSLLFVFDAASENWVVLGDGTLTTSNVAEGTNFYYTEPRVSANTDVTANTTDRHSHSNSATLDAITAPYTSAEETKLSGIETAATADQTATEILDAIKTVDGSGSGLDADLLDGNSGSHYEDASNLSTGLLPGARFDDTSHGNRPGANLHSTATTASAGFMDSGDKTKLDGIEALATVDQSASSILSLMLTVDGSASGLDADLLDGEHKAFFTNAGNLDAGTLPAARFDDAAHGSRTLPTLHATVTTASSGFMASTDKTKLDGIETAATADQTGAEIKSAYEGETNTNAFTDTEQTKLTGIEAAATADQTGAEIKTAYEAEANTNVDTADALTTSRQIALDGDLTGSAAFDGSANISIVATVVDDSHTHDTRYYTETEIDSNFLNSSNLALTYMESSAINANFLNISGSTSMSGDLNMGSQKIINLTAGVDADDAVNKSQLDAAQAGILVKGQCRVATTAILPTVTQSGSSVGATLTATASGILAIDGINTVLSDRVLVKNQASASDNGIYKLTTEGTAGVPFVLTRAVDYDGNPGGEVAAGTFTFVDEGTANGKSGWALLETGLTGTGNPIEAVVDTDPLNFTKFQGLPSYTAGDGLQLISNEFSVVNSEILDAVKAVDGSGSGLDADLLDGYDSTAFRGLNSGANTQDPNLVSEPYILTNHVNSPNSTYYWHVRTQFYTNVSSTAHRAQIAIQYNLGAQCYVRSYFTGAWTTWQKLTATKADIDALNVDADTLDGLSATSFLRSDAADSHSGTITPSTNNSLDLGSAALKYANVYATTFQGESTSTVYADLAERYEADKKYEPGTVVIFGGQKEIQACVGYADTRVAGVISTDPAFKMNSEAGNDTTHPYVALKGRVPCKVIGMVEKGDLLTTSDRAGYAVRADKDTPHWAIFAKALGASQQESAVIEVVIQ